VSEKASAQVVAFNDKVAAEDEALKLSRKSQYTDEIAAADSERDTLYSAYCTMERAFSDDSDAEKAAAESFNVKTKQLRAALRGIVDEKFFLFRLSTSYA